MRHFALLPEQCREALFAQDPASFDQTSRVSTLWVGLGGTLYCPATRPRLADDIARCTARGASSMAFCLEDAVSSADVDGAVNNLVRQLQLYRATAAGGPLLFVRVRDAHQVAEIVTRLGSAVDLLSGFVLPKITSTNGVDYLEAVADAAEITGLALYAMPVIEAPELIHRETRVEALIELHRLLAKFRDRILAVRLGATDLCSLYGLRRPRNVTIYDVRVAADVIGDVVNVLGRVDGSGYTISGPVWEHFDRDAAGPTDAFVREIQLDRANGLSGKTIIHPSHLADVHGWSVVTDEEYRDARDIVDREEAEGGVFCSAYGNKMNESKPHQTWARRVLDRAEVFGVLRPDIHPGELHRALTER